MKKAKILFSLPVLLLPLSVISCNKAISNNEIKKRKLDPEPEKPNNSKSEPSASTNPNGLEPENPSDTEVEKQVDSKYGVYDDLSFYDIPRFNSKTNENLGKLVAWIYNLPILAYKKEVEKYKRNNSTSVNPKDSEITNFTLKNYFNYEGNRNELDDVFDIDRVNLEFKKLTEKFNQDMKDKNIWKADSSAFDSIMNDYDRMFLNKDNIDERIEWHSERDPDYESKIASLKNQNFIMKKAELPLFYRYVKTVHNSIKGWFNLFKELLNPILKPKNELDEWLKIFTTFEWDNTLLLDEQIKNIKNFGGLWQFGIYTNILNPFLYPALSISTSELDNSEFSRQFINNKEKTYKPTQEYIKSKKRYDPLYNPKNDPEVPKFSLDFPFFNDKTYKNNDSVLTFNKFYEMARIGALFSLADDVKISLTNNQEFAILIMKEQKEHFFDYSHLNKDGLEIALTVKYNTDDIWDLNMSREQAISELEKWLEEYVWVDKENDVFTKRKNLFNIKFLKSDASLVDKSQTERREIYIQKMLQTHNWTQDELLNKSFEELVNMYEDYQKTLVSKNDIKNY
ncbi:hypothetical protein [Mesomycoplasma lagogenitalium]|uniref:Lipoprotein n=1 Tax=Mesomycoplasma lagogenitalium TaxID=171286 RepID=A0ABY8LUN2_9BACT|nr:hypothetical protein [Mesomycoplasma lagogenitalium]WGI36947.1 hypothetical protein QEG99_01535 [Mesomycoplasma lagogenitalium]